MQSDMRLECACAQKDVRAVGPVSEVYGEEVSVDVGEGSADRDLQRVPVSLAEQFSSQFG